MSLCENSCIYQGYNYTDKKVECKCKIKSNNKSSCTKLL